MVRGEGMRKGNGFLCIFTDVWGGKERKDAWMDGNRNSTFTPRRARVMFIGYLTWGDEINDCSSAKLTSNFQLFPLPLFENFPLLTRDLAVRVAVGSVASSRK